MPCPLQGPFCFSSSIKGYLWHAFCILLIETGESHRPVFILHLRPLSPQYMQISGGWHPSLRRYGHCSLNK